MKVAAILLLIAVALAVAGILVKGLIWLLIIAAALVAVSVLVGRRRDRGVHAGRVTR